MTIELIQYFVMVLMQTVQILLCLQGHYSSHEGQMESSGIDNRDLRHMTIAD